MSPAPRQTTSLRALRDGTVGPSEVATGGHTDDRDDRIFVQLEDTEPCAPVATVLEGTTRLGLHVVPRLPPRRPSANSEVDDDDEPQRKCTRRTGRTRLSKWPSRHPVQDNRC